MKKLTILTSLLALTACGGGSGGGSAPLVVPSNMPLTNSNLADKLGDMTLFFPEGEVKFNIEDGNIVSVTEKFEDEEELTTFNRVGDSNEFKAYEYQMSPNVLYDIVDTWNVDLVNEILLDHESAEDAKAELYSRNETVLRNYCETHGIDDETRDQVLADIRDAINNDVINELERIDIIMEINSYGQSAGLRYSDIGSLKYKLSAIIDGQNMSDESATVYFSGYQPNEVAQPTESATFTGTAIAAINFVDHARHDEKSMNSTTDFATLTVDSNGKETLNMQFSRANDNPWYDVVIDSDRTVSVDVNAASNARITDADYRLTQTMQDNLQVHEFDTSYYAESNTAPATEAINYTQFTAGRGVGEQNIIVDTVFGGTKD